MIQPGKFYVGHLGRVPVYVAIEAIFILLFVYYVVPVGQVGLAGYLITLVALLLTILMHELGHAILAIATGMSGVAITIGAMGGYCSYEGERSPKRALPIVLAGVSMNFILWWLASSLVPHVAGVDSQILVPFLLSFAWWNLALGIFNSLPIYPLDGGQAALLISRLVARGDAGARRFTLSLTVATAVLALGYIYSRTGQVPSFTLMLVVLLVFQAFRDLR